MTGLRSRMASLVFLTAVTVVLPVTATQNTMLGPMKGVRTLNELEARAFRSNELLVRFKPNVRAQAQIGSFARTRLQKIRSLRRSGWVRVELPVGVAVTQAMSRFAGDPNVEAVQPNYIYRLTAAPNDPKYGDLWAFRNTGQTIATGTYPVATGTAGSDMNVEPAWDHLTDCSPAVVAVLDSGVNYQQEDLAPNMWDGGISYPNHGYDFVDDDLDPMDLNGHGTHVAGTIGAVGNNSIGVTGVCWTATIMAIRVADAAGQATTASIIQGIDFAIENDAKIINMSLGGAGFDPALSSALSRAHLNDVVAVVAAGNGGGDQIGDNNDSLGNAFYPCNFTHPNIVCVAALDQTYNLASFSNFGSVSVDVGAPGTNIVSTWAGATMTITDDFNSSGSLDWTSSGGWAYRPLGLSGGGTTATVHGLVNPSNFPDGAYVNNADHRVYQPFDLAGQDVAILRFSTQFSLQAGDSFNIGISSAGDDPFLGGGVVVDGVSGMSTGGFIVGPLTYDISSCNSATCSIGFQLSTDGSGVDDGVGIISFSIESLALNANSYHTLDGTSMATPHVTAVAAMLRAYNPRFTYADVVNAIKNGGRTVASLAGKTTSGKAADAMRMLAYINAPTGVTASVH